MKKSPSLALKIGTSLGFCLVFAPCFWRFGLFSLATLFLPLSIAGVWGKFYSRSARLSRIEQDWEIFYTAFFILACGLGIIAYNAFSLGDRENIFPKNWIIPAFVITFVASAITFRFHPDFKPGGPGAKVFLYVAFPLLAFLFAFGDLAYINGALDFRAPRIYLVSIQSKRLSSGSNGKGGRGPLFKVPFWHDKTRSVEISVPYKDWRRARIGDTARVNIKPGLLGAEWVEAVRVD